MLAIATAVFTYYTAWVFVLPFVDESNILNSFFLPREYAIKIPILLVLIAGLGVGTFVGNVLIKSAQKEKLKKSKKSE
jgi:dolichyl-phosphate mannosyltransferase polypeptide 2 regulatory subunit